MQTVVSLNWQNRWNLVVKNVSHNTNNVKKQNNLLGIIDFVILPPSLPSHTSYKNVSGPCTKPVEKTPKDATLESPMLRPKFPNKNWVKLLLH